jgi:DNA-binding MarR family transcriptional regulator
MFACSRKPLMPNPKITEVEPVGARAWPLFLLAHTVLVEQMEARAAAAGVASLTWYDALWSLERAPGSRLRMSELADHMVLSRSNITRLIDKLEDEGLVLRERLQDDRRGAAALITSAGKRLRKSTWAVYEKAIAELFEAPLTSSERETLAKAMRKLIDHVRSLNPG